MYCSKLSANIKCDYMLNRKGAKKHYFHLVCGVKKDCLFRFEDRFPSYCGSHARRLRETKTPRIHSETEICTICRDTMNKFNPIKSILAPCCRNGFFHKHCIMQFASTAGYFFKCPLCNDNKIFREKIVKLGVFIPNKDAAWECDSNAFNELLESPRRCNLCEQVRYGRKNKPLVVKICCDTCGAFSAHIACWKENFLKNTCPICLELEKTKAQLAEQAENQINAPQTHPPLISESSLSESASPSSSQQKTYRLRSSRSLLNDSLPSISYISATFTRRRVKRVTDNNSIEENLPSVNENVDVLNKNPIPEPSKNPETVNQNPSQETEDFYSFEDVEAENCAEQITETIIPDDVSLNCSQNYSDMDVTVTSECNVDDDETNEQIDSDKNPNENNISILDPNNTSSHLENNKESVRVQEVNSDVLGSKNCARVADPVEEQHKNNENTASHSDKNNDNVMHLDENIFTNDVVMDHVEKSSNTTDMHESPQKKDCDNERNKDAMISDNESNQQNASHSIQNVPDEVVMSDETVTTEIEINQIALHLEENSNHDVLSSEAEDVILIDENNDQNAKEDNDQDTPNELTNPNNENQKTVNNDELHEDQNDLIIDVEMVDLVETNKENNVTSSNLDKNNDNSLQQEKNSNAKDAENDVIIIIDDDDEHDNKINEPIPEKDNQPNAITEKEDDERIILQLTLRMEDDTQTPPNDSNTTSNAPQTPSTVSPSHTHATDSQNSTSSAKTTTENNDDSEQPNNSTNNEEKIIIVLKKDTNEPEYIFYSTCPSPSPPTPIVVLTDDDDDDDGSDESDKNDGSDDEDESPNNRECNVNNNNGPEIHNETSRQSSFIVSDDEDDETQDNASQISNYPSDEPHVNLEIDERTPPVSSDVIVLNDDESMDGQVNNDKG